MNGPDIEKGKAYFRAVGLRTGQVEAFRKCLGALPVDSRWRKDTDDYIVFVELPNAEICAKVCLALSSIPLTVSYGLWISLVTERDSNGVMLEPYMCDFYRQVGGSLDFSFTVLD